MHRDSSPAKLVFRAQKMLPGTSIQWVGWDRGPQETLVQVGARLRETLATLAEVFSPPLGDSGGMVPI